MTEMQVPRRAVAREDNLFSRVPPKLLPV